MNQVTTAPAPRRLRADAARNQQRIIAAARELFADRGLEVTLDDVAERAGVGVGTVYRRFANKQELISEVFDQMVTELAGAVDVALHHPDPWLGLVDLFEYSCRHIATNRGFGEVVLELHDSMDRFAAMKDTIRPGMQAVITRAHAAGVLQPDIEAGDFFAMVNMVDAVACFARPINPDVWHRYSTLMLNAIRGESVARMDLTPGPLTDEEVDRAKEVACGARKR